MADRAALERQYLLLKTLADRQRTDPLLTWEPHTKQRNFIEGVLGDRWFENWLFAANRAGKSDAGAYCGAKLARFGIPNPKPAIGASTVVWDRATSGWVVSLDFPSSRDIIQPKYFDNGFVPAGVTHAPFIPDREVEEWRVSDQVLKLKNGSIIGFKSGDSGRKKFQGTEKDWIHFDEEPAKEVYTECTIRVGGGRRLRVFGTCTLLPPEGQIGGVTWAYTDIVKPWQDGKLTEVQVWQASIYDNPHIDPAEVARLEAKYPEGSIERRIRLDGELLPGLSGSRAYAAFSYGVHVCSLPPLELRRPLCWTLDFNVAPMVSLIGQRSRNVFRVYRELVVEDDASIDSMVDLFRSEFPSHRAEVWIYGDATGQHRSSQTARSHYSLIMAGLRGYPVPVRLKVTDINPRVPDRINAVNRALRDEFGAIGVEIDPTCEELIADMEGVLRDPRGGIKKTYNPKDSYFRRTHTSDALGYWIHREQPVTSEPLNPFRREAQGGRNVPRMRLPSYGTSFRP